MVKFVVISPVRNEEKFLLRTIQSMEKQILKPSEWILVNDGSSDKTQEIIETYLSRYPWMKLINLKDRGFYAPGGGVVKAFYAGFESIKEKDWEFVVKMDCDLEFDHNYFSEIFARVSKNDKLGIVSGWTYLEKDNKLVSEKNQHDHPCGPCKIYRKTCFEAIGGLKLILGWDLADLLKAQMLGWETYCYEDLRLTHLRPTGSLKKGWTRGKFLQGRIEYRHGYLFSYTFLKAVYHVLDKPYLMGLSGKIFGYLYAYINKDEMIFDKDMVQFLRSKQRNYLKNNLVNRFLSPKLK